MRINKKNVLNAICKSNGWQCIRCDSAWYILGRDGFPAIFIRTNEATISKSFVFLADLHYIMTHADTIFVDHIHIENPYVGLSDEEILIKCDLEVNT